MIFPSVSDTIVFGGDCMRRILPVVLLFLFLCIPVSAHPGGTDENGGHYDRNTGEYHYHHGYDAHQHPNGECPYDFKDNVDHDREYYDSDSYEETTAFWESPDFQNGDEADNYEYFQSLEKLTTEVTEKTTKAPEKAKDKKNIFDIMEIGFNVVVGIIIGIPLLYIAGTIVYNIIIVPIVLLIEKIKEKK